MTVGAYVVLFLLTSALPALGIAHVPWAPLSFGWPMLAMASLAMALILRSLIYVVWGPQFVFYTSALRPAWQLPLGIRIRPDQLFILAAAWTLVVLLYLLLQKTRMGRAMRATADNAQLALVTGIDTDRVVVWTWVLGAALAAAAGVL